jgi:adenine-specific DNA-methyltransferase
MAKYPKKLTVETLAHDEATRKNIPTAEYQSVVAIEDFKSLNSQFEISNPQLNWIAVFRSLGERFTRGRLSTKSCKER